MPAAPAPANALKPFALDQIAEVNQRALTQAARANARLMRDMLRMHTHLMAFAARRFQRDADAAAKLAECEDAPEMVTVAQTFCAQAMTDYAEEAAELMRLTARVANGAAQEAAAVAHEGAAKA